MTAVLTEMGDVAERTLLAARCRAVPAVVFELFVAVMLCCDDALTDGDHHAFLSFLAYRLLFSRHHDVFACQGYVCVSVRVRIVDLVVCCVQFEDTIT